MCKLRNVRANNYFYAFEKLPTRKHPRSARIKSLGAKARRRQAKCQVIPKRCSFPSNSSMLQRRKYSRHTFGPKIVSPPRNNHPREIVPVSRYNRSISSTAVPSEPNDTFPADLTPCTVSAARDIKCCPWPLNTARGEPLIRRAGVAKIVGKKCRWPCSTVFFRVLPSSRSFQSPPRLNGL